MLDMKTKTLVGKIFTLTNHKEIPYKCELYLETVRMHRDMGKTIPKENLGDAIMIYDESAKRVKTTTKDGKLIWISKNYLKQSAEQVIESPAGEMQTLIDELVKISSKTDPDSSKRINDLLVKARSVLSFIENINK
jgi:hypothetical protein